MTSKKDPDQAERRGRAVWLARLPAGSSQVDGRHRDRQFDANKLARARGADVIGEFLISTSSDEGPTDYVWSEVLDFLRHLRADLLVVMTPDEIASAFADYYRRTESLEAAGIGLAIWAVDGARQISEESRAA